MRTTPTVPDLAAQLQCIILEGTVQADSAGQRASGNLHRYRGDPTDTNPSIRSHDSDAGIPWLLL